MLPLVPEVKFTRSGNIDLAYQVIGEGPLDIVIMIGWVSHLEVIWELPEVRHFLERFTAMGRVVLFDKRGTGLSDRSPIGSFEEMVPDVLAVMDAADMESAVIVGWSDAAVIALMVAAAHPERVRSLILGEVLATGVPDEAHPWGLDPDVMEALADSLELGSWGQGVMLSMLAPSLADDERISSWFRKLERTSATPTIAADLLRRTLSADVRPLLGDVEAPTLVVHRKDAPLLPSEAMDWLAEELANGVYAGVSGDQITGYLGDVDELLDEVEDFLLGTRVGAFADRRVMTILFSDVVGSTERVADIGDRRWYGLLETHRSDVRRLLARYGGREIDTAGDGFLIAFDTPTPAIQCGLAICDVSKHAGLDVRVGLHSGEVVVKDDDLTGVAVHIGARVAARATGAEVLVSSTVKDLVVGSGFAFTSKGRHELKGVPGTWELFRVDG